MTLERRPSGNGTIARREDVAVVEISEGATLHAQDIRPPVLALIQAQSLKGDQEGNFMRLDTEEEFERLEITPLLVQPVRTYWGQGAFSRDRTPLCYSINGVTGALVHGDGTPTEHPGQDCMSCPAFTAKPWADRAEDGWCVPGYFAVVMDAQSYEIYIIRLSGANAKFGRIFSGKGVMRRAVLELTSAEIKSNKGTYHQMRVKTLRKLDEGEAEIADAYFSDYRRMQVTVDDSQEAEQTQESKSEAQPIARTTAAQPAARQSRDAVVNGDAVPAYGADGAVITDEDADDEAGFPW